LSFDVSQLTGAVMTECGFKYLMCNSTPGFVHDFAHFRGKLCMEVYAFLVFLFFPGLFSSSEVD
jgi:hypothetical protein